MSDIEVVNDQTALAARAAELIAEKIETYRSGLAVNMPFADVDTYYSSFEAELRNFWTNGSFYCIFAGMGWVPEKSVPCIRYRPVSQRKAAAVFKEIKRKSAELRNSLPSNYEFLRELHGH